MWRAKLGPIGAAMASIVDDHAADVWAFTEVRSEAGITPSAPGYTIDAGPDWGYRVPQRDRRKVMLWSRNPWSNLEVGDIGALRGRLVAGTTGTPLGELRVVGVCIPWRGSHVTSGRRDLGPWEDHLDFLDRLPDFLDRQPRPCVVAGDFNQRIPPLTDTPETRRLHRLLLEALQGFSVATEGIEPHLLDHLANSSDLGFSRVSTWPGTMNGRELTDHFGACADFEMLLNTAV